MKNGSKILELIEKRYRLNQTQVAEKLRVTLPCYRQWKQGKNHLPIWRVTQILRIWSDTTPEEIVTALDYQYTPAQLERLIKRYNPPRKLKLGERMRKKFWPKDKRGRH